jgi:thiamine-monophosphate kinase
MKLKEIGEFGLIDHLARGLKHELPTGWLGIGDDCAVIPTASGEVDVITTDMLIENTHFLRQAISPEELGYKSLAVNLSDVAAMGAKPISAFIALAIPQDLEVEWLSRFYHGMQELADSAGVHIMGGDTTRSPQGLSICITAMGRMPQCNLKLRSMTKPGDIVCLSGTIGDSPAGLQLLLHNRADAENPEHAHLLRRHNHPRPHLAEGLWLGKQPAVHAMMDVSDGIDSDLRRICEQSHTGILVNLDALPLSPELQNVCKNQGWNAAQLAATGGEDYCLVCTIDAEMYPEIAAAFSAEFSQPLTAIGRVVDSYSGLRYQAAGTPVTLEGHGFDHFTK